MGAQHSFAASVTWPTAGVAEGDPAGATTSYAAYTRDHDVTAPGHPVVPGSADPAFRGDGARYSPEELLVASLAQCHMLWFLHLAAEARVVVRGYTDAATGTMRVESRGEGQFTDVTLHPQVVVDAASDVTDARLAELHHRAHALCFVARSVNFPVLVEPMPLRTSTTV
ncbi:organic hydroperoxide reductase OsmC/OhrA [Isoptericola jiangsuensis]|uniref:Organic hydroperoxide reductase OsmC/OhrA n=1 Tax=Isoptericola jiangsuensis TaxID=548579 RepID=A0A2A9EX15_9MICO|nr:OsmC family protein [Isoptericola jiangsuensis]PFG43116.1 organic hydroperoxide reductase OsmC/OhrA [Isoptericola jiangsuensis]